MRGYRAGTGSPRARTPWRRVAVVVMAGALLGCAAPPPSVDLPGWTGEHLLTPPGLGWQTLPMPGKRWAPYEVATVAGEPALRVKADRSVSILRQRFDPPLAAPGMLTFRWRADHLPLEGDLADVARTDSPVGVVLAFDGDRRNWPARAHRLSELTRLVTGEELPYATLAYVWSEQHPVGTVISNPRTDRIRKLVVDSGRTHLGQWREHRRDVQADFRRAFGEAPGPLRGVAFMTDTDNTQSRLTAWYGGLSLSPAVD